MKKNKLVYIITLSTFGGEQMGGAQVHVLNLIRNIDFQRYQVFLIVGNEGVLTKKVRELGVKVYIADKMNNPVNPIKDHAALNQIRKFLKEIKPDIVHTHSSKGGYLGRLAASKEKVSVITHSVQGFAFPRVSGLKHIAYLAAERKVGMISDAIICASIKDKADAVNNKIVKDFKKLEVINNGYDDDIPWDEFTKIDLAEKYGIPKNQRTAAMIARLDEQKNPIEYLKGVKYYLDMNKDEGIKFLLIGQGTEKDNCIKFINDNQLQDNIIAGDWLPLNPDYYQVLKSVDLMILPSLWEGLPLAVIDSMRIGTPVLASDIPGTVELIDDNETGFLYHSGDYENLGMRLAEIFSDNKLMKQAAKKALIKIKDNYSYRYITSLHMELYEKLLKQKRKSHD